MRSIEIPSLAFCPWYSWANRKTIKGAQLPGVYLISISEKPLDGVAPSWPDVSYVGMTTSRNGLVGRWNQFNASIHGRAGHSGGKSVFEHLGHYQTWTMKLYVSAMAVQCNTINCTPEDFRKLGWIAFLEYDALAAFREQSGGPLPRYNTHHAEIAL